MVVEGDDLLEPLWDVVQGWNVVPLMEFANLWEIAVLPFFVDDLPIHVEQRLGLE